jgi:septum formation inhibitor MinC
LEAHLFSREQKEKEKKKQTKKKKNNFKSAEKTIRSGQI